LWQDPLAKLDERDSQASHHPTYQETADVDQESIRPWGSAHHC